MWKAEIRRMVVQDQPREGVSGTPIPTNKPGIVVHISNPNPGKKWRPYPKSN
jgi:hypothetical protein